MTKEPKQNSIKPNLANSRRIVSDVLVKKNSSDTPKPKLNTDTAQTIQNQPKTKPKKKRKLIIIGLIVIAILSVITGLLYWKYHKKINIQLPISGEKKEEEKPTLFESPLTGQMVSEEVVSRPVVASVIENLSTAARPQSGLSNAGVVYETLAEGGITRYMAVFLDTYPDDLGPVRSLRPFFIDWAKEYDTPLMHVGGSALALSQVGPKQLKDLNQFSLGSYFRRISSRSAPHNVYITKDKITKLLNDKKYNSKATFAGWLRKDDSKSATPNASTINVNISTASYNSRYTYNTETNDYNRFIGGVADIDANTKAQIKVKNIIVEFTSITYQKLSADNKVNTITQTTGSGKVLIFRDGTVVEGTWKKADTNSRTTFVDAAGNPISLNRGNSWVTVVPVGSAVTYQ